VFVRTDVISDSSPPPPSLDRLTRPLHTETEEASPLPAQLPTLVFRQTQSCLRAFSLPVSGFLPWEVSRSPPQGDFQPVSGTFLLGARFLFPHEAYVPRIFEYTGARLAIAGVRREPGRLMLR